MNTRNRILKSIQIANYKHRKNEPVPYALTAHGASAQQRAVYTYGPAHKNKQRRLGAQRAVHGCGVLLFAAKRGRAAHPVGLVGSAHQKNRFRSFTTRRRRWAVAHQVFFFLFSLSIFPVVFLLSLFRI